MPSMNLNFPNLNLTESVSTKVETIGVGYITVEKFPDIKLSMDASQINQLSLVAGSDITLEPVTNTFVVTVKPPKKVSEPSAAPAKVGASPAFGQRFSNVLE